MGRICLAGSVRIEADGGVYEGAGLGRPGRLVLAYLVHQRARPVGRDELAELCWGDELPRSWEQLVRGVVAKIRAAFTAVGWSGQDVLVTGFGGYQLRLPPGTVVDVEAAGAQLFAAGEALEAGEPEVAAKEAAQALEVAAAGFLPGAGGPWAEARAAELGELHLRALDLASAAAAALERWDEAADAAAAALAVEPYRESAHVALMVALAGGGERAGALRAYERCRSVLAEELGVPPGARAQAVYAELLSEEDEGPPPPSDGAAALAFPPALRQVAAGPFVGRDAELTAFGAALDRARGGERQVVLVAGDPGIGKTRLVAEFGRVAQVAGARVLYGRADEDLGIPYAPVVEAIEGYVAQAPVGELAGHAARHGGELARVVHGLAVRLPDVASEQGDGDRHRLMAAAADLVAGAARAAPVVLIADDLQWAAAPGLGMLRHLVRTAGSSPVVVVAAHRHFEAGSPLVDLLAQMGREPGVVRLSLEGLDESAVAEYLALGDLRAADADRASARKVHTQTGGNPFFVGELVRHLAEGRTGTPVGVVEMVRARLAQRSLACQQALAQAAVVGSTFSFDVLARLTAEDPDALVDSLEEATKAAFVVEEDRPGRYHFVHAILRDAIYDQLSATRRARLHRAVGEALLATDKPESVERATALAHHFCAAAPIGGGTEGARHALAAAYLAMNQYAWEDAAAQAQNGLEALAWDAQPDLELRYQLLIAIVRARIWTASIYHDETVQAGLAAAETARLLGSPERMALAVCASLKHFSGWGDCQDSKNARALGREALEALGDDAPAARAVLLAMLAMPAQGFVSEADSREAMRLARACGDPLVLGKVLVHRCMVLDGSGRPEEQLALAEELVSLPEQATTAAFKPLLGGLRMRALARLQLGDRNGYAADRAAFERAGRSYRWARAEVDARNDVLLQHLLDGRFAQVEAVLLEERLLEVGLPANACRRGVPTFGEIGAALRWAHVARERGDIEDLPKLLVLLNDLRQKDRTARALVARSHLELGDVAAARRELVALEAIGFDDLPDRAMTLAYLAEVAAELQDKVWAARLLSLLQPHEGQLVVARITSVCPGAADRYIGQLATVLEDWQDAESRFQAASSLEEHINAPPLLARTRWCHAQMLHRRDHAGDRATAADLLSSVLDITDRLGMPPLHDEAEKLLAALGR